MSQAEVDAWLRANPGWHRSKDIAAGIGCSAASVVACIKRMRARGEVLMMKTPGKGTPYVYRAGENV